MGRTAKEITGCIILNPLTPAAAMRALKTLNEMDLPKNGLEPCVTPRLKRSWETGAVVPKDSKSEEVG